MSANMTDTQAFVEQLRGLDREPGKELHGFFESGHPVSVARAPGRLDVMGGIADYSGSLVLQLPIQEATFVALQLTRGQTWRIASLPASVDGCLRCVELSRQDRDRFGDYASARQQLQEDSSTAWVAYLVGVALVLGQELGANIDRGCRLLVRSEVPEAKGVSSSAALEVAAMRAWAHRLGIAIDGVEAARLCQMAENQVVGAPCGIMDQMTSALGRSGELLALLCQPAEVQGTVRLPDSLGSWGIDSGIRHSVSGSDYTSVRTGAFMGYRMIASMAGLDVTAPDSDSVVRVNDPRWHGYLANLTTAEFEGSYAARLPEQMAGAEFLCRYQGTSDPVTRVEPERMYAIRQPTAHPIYEHARVRRFRDLLAKPVDEPTLIEMGELMYASHASYSECGLGSSGTDQLVDMVREAGPASGLFGAKITGGGSGGTVAILGHRKSGDAVEQIARSYAHESGQGGYVFRGSSSGAWNKEVCTVDL
jgi:L-arabinokinase